MKIKNNPFPETDCDEPGDCYGKIYKCWGCSFRARDDTGWMFKPHYQEWLSRWAKRADAFSRYRNPYITGSITLQTLTDVIWRDEGFTGCCGDLTEPFVKDAMAGSKLTVQIEHLLPVSRGGTNVTSNLAIWHEECNQKKGNLTVAENLRGYRTCSDCGKPTKKGRPLCSRCWGDQHDECPMCGDWKEMRYQRCYDCAGG